MSTPSGDERETKEVVISLAVSVDKDASHETIASTLEETLSGIAEKVHNVSDVQVRTVPRVLFPGEGGYDSRLWEKATCDIFGGGKLRHPDGDPDVLQGKLEQLSAEVRTLSERVQSLTEGGANQ